MKLNIQKLQQGTNFWGIQNNEYTKNYKNAVDNIKSNQTTFTNIVNNLAKQGVNITSPEQFDSLAFDKKIGPVHNSIVNYGSSLKTKFLPKDLVKYKTGPGRFNTAPAHQIVNTHKTEFDQLLDANKNDSVAAFSEMTQKFPSMRKVGTYKGYPTGKTQPMSTLTTTLQLGGTFKNSPYNFLNIFKPKMGNFDISEAVNFIDKFEGFKDKVYKDGKGIDTIGHGLTDPKYVKKGKITKEESLNGMREHINKQVLPHLSSKPYWKELNDNQKASLVSYVYNIGSGNFNTKSPNLQKALNSKNWEEAAKQMDFGYTDIKNPGLRKRRDEERKLFLSK